jgi:ribosomal protein S18 acetylase RimI-like enzyme
MSTCVAVASVDEPGLAELLAFAVGDDADRVKHVVSRYRDESSARLLVAMSGQRPVAVLGYMVTEDRVIVLHIATATCVRRAGIATALLTELRRRIPRGLPITAETDADAVGFYRSNGFAITSLGEKYPGVERFHVALGSVEGVCSVRSVGPCSRTQTRSGTC